MKTCFTKICLWGVFLLAAICVQAAHGQTAAPQNGKSVSGTVVDEKGNAFYTVRVRTNKTTIGNNLPVIPGMVAEVDIITGEKSVLSYLLKPVLRAKARAMTER